MVCIGAECDLSNGVLVQESVIWNLAVVKADCSIIDSIIGDGVEVTESLEGEAMAAQGKTRLAASSRLQS
jgi:NDP-sugar pyrophosphorylase family protein